MLTPVIERVQKSQTLKAFLGPKQFGIGNAQPVYRFMVMMGVCFISQSSCNFAVF